MALRCPVCKADNAQGPSCRRCKADLSTLFALDEYRNYVLAAGRWHLSRGEHVRAAERFLVAQRQRNGPDVLRDLAVTALLHRDFSSAWRFWQQLQELEAPATTPA